MNIAKKLGTTKQTANKLISSLAKKGYVHTVPSKLDKRAINIEITPEGKKALISCSEKSTYFLADMFHDFTTDEIETFWRLLQKLYRFDGEEQDGFEEKAHLKVEDQAQFISDDYEEKKSWLNFQNGDMGVQTMNNMLYRKVKETEDKMKEKCYELKDKI
ncbi:Transcriptional regulator, MarR family [Bacillus amyloliquefaciens]|nr:Transcriptional regulator, MarR family [Bacillus amyloliquefaciens]